jgi:hypothetical protein
VLRRLSAQALGFLIAAIFVASLIASISHGHRGSLPAIALKWPFLLYVERAGGVTLITLLVAVVVMQLLGGALPSKVSNTSIEWSTAAVSSALSAPARAVDQATLDALDEVKKRIDRIEKRSEPPGHHRRHLSPGRGA